MSTTDNNAINDPPVAPLSEFGRLLDEHICAGYQILYVHTTEEARVETEIRHVAKHRAGARGKHISVITWDSVDAFVDDPAAFRQEGASVDRKRLESNPPRVDYKNPHTAIAAVEDPKLVPESAIFIFRDLDEYLTPTGNEPLRRRLRSLAEQYRITNATMQHTLIILSPRVDVPEKLKQSITVLEYQLPTLEEHVKTVEYVQQSIQYEKRANATSPAKTSTPISPELVEQIAAAMLGLTSNEAINCLSRCVVRHGGLSPESLPTIKEEKAAIIRKSEMLTYIPESSIPPRTAIGGYDNFMKWLDQRKLAYTREARELQIDPPRGVVLVGIPGTGKSVVAKIAGHCLGLPSYVLDIGSLFGSKVGESEARTRSVLKQVDAQNGCVLVIDEADKALGNAHESVGDSGVTRRIFGQILSWLSENKSRTFVIMTLNRTSSVAPELLRAGRFDKIFYTTTPSPAERRQIMEIHFDIRGVRPEELGWSAADWATLVDKTDTFVGSELEQVVRDARYLSLAQSRSGVPTLAQMAEAIAGITPLAKLDPKSIEEIDKFCETSGALPVTTPQATVKPAKTHRTRKVDVSAN